MNPSMYLRTGDLVTISHEGQFLAIESLTESIPRMKELVSNPINAVFLLSTQKCLQRSLAQQKPLTVYNDDEIYYNEPVILYHLLSDKFLTYSKDIENKATVELINTFKQNCKFSIKPIFKCQTVITRRIRNTEQVVISPAEHYNHEGNIAMVVLRNENRKNNHSYVLMKKNEHSQFELCRKNDHRIGGSSVSSLYTYQLLNIETKKNLYMSDSQDRHKDVIVFEKSINQFASYFDFRPKNSNYEAIGVIEQEIEYNNTLYIHSWKEHKYLSIDAIGDVCLAESPSQQAEFQIEAYGDEKLTKDSVVKIRHVASKKYLSFNPHNNQVITVAEKKLIDTYLIVKVPIAELRLNGFINDAHAIIKQELSVQSISYKNRKNLFKVLRELVSFIYGDQLTLADFLSMDKALTCRLSLNDQKLLANVGIISTLANVAKTFIQQVTKAVKQGEQQRRDRSEQHTLIVYTLMSIVGICSKNAANTRVLMQSLPFLYESLVEVPGIIESLYNLFKDSKQLLLVLQNTSHRVGRKELASMELLINMLTGKKLDILTKCKILRLLEVLIIVNHKQKIQGHEAILLKSFTQNKLEPVMLPMKANQHADLLIFIPQRQTFIELEQFLTQRKNYEKELQLLKVQLELLSSLCLNSSSQCFAYARKIITEEMIFRYLKGNLQPEFKEAFMRLLIDIYLSNLSSRNYDSSKNFVLMNSERPRNVNYSKVEDSMRDTLLDSEEGHELTEFKSVPSHSKAIENIQNLILDGTKNSISQQKFDSSFYMNIKSLRKFLELKILDSNEVGEFKSLLTNYILKYSKGSFKEQEKRKIILQILKIMTDYVNQEIDSISQDFIIMLTERDIPSHRAYQQFQNFSKNYPFFSMQVQRQQLYFLPKLIKESIEYNDSKILIAATSLLKMLNERASLFVKQLKDRIIINSSWSVEFYNKINKIRRELKKGIQEHMNHKTDAKQITFVEQQLNQSVKQLNYLFFESFNSASTQFSQLTQNIYRQMNLLEIIVNFLNESQEKFKESTANTTSDVYSSCFEFIGLYLQDNRQNFYRFQQKYLDIKFVFEHRDRGQIKFLNNLIKMPNARNLMIDEIINCILLSFEHNPEPNPYTLLALLNAITTPHLDKQRIEMLVEKILRDPRMFMTILKVGEKKSTFKFVWSFRKDEPNYHKHWLIYSYLLMKFLLTLLEHSTERTTLALEIQKYICLPSILDFLRSKDLIINTSMQNLESTLLKTQIIKLFGKIYLPVIDKQKQEIIGFFSYITESIQNMSHLKEQHSGSLDMLVDEVIQKTTDEGAIIFESEVRNKSNLTIRNLEVRLSTVYISIVQYFPFFAKILDTFINSALSGEADALLKREAESKMDDIFKTMKDFVAKKLTYNEYNKSNKEYQTAITNCEDLFKRKLGFNLSIDEDYEDEEEDEVEVTDYFMNSKIENTMKCLRFASNKNEIKIYETFISMFYSEQLARFLEQDSQLMKIQLSIEELEKIVQMLTKYVNYDRDKFAQVTQLFSFFARCNKHNCLKINYLNAREVVMAILANQKQDASNERLCSYLNVSRNLLEWEVNAELPIERRTPGHFPFQPSFIARICKKLDSEKMLYFTSKIDEQNLTYCQNTQLSFERGQEFFSVEVCLEWSRNMSIVTSQHHKQAHYSELFMSVVDLLKAYTNFIKEFNSRYINYELYNKLNLCLEIVFHFIAGLTRKSVFINYLIERQIWNDLNEILGLDDGWVRNVDEMEDDQQKTFAKVIRSQLQPNPRLFLKQAEKMYHNTKKIYKQVIPQKCYPLLPIKSLFSSAKCNVISILKQFKNLPLQIEQQVFSRIEVPIINKNIFEVYRKHNILYRQYGIPSVEIDIDYQDGDEWKQIAENVSLENGIDLASIKMHLGSIGGSTEIKTEYNNLRLEAMNSKKIQSAFSSFFTFLRDFVMLFIFCFVSLCRKKKSALKKDEQNIDEKKMKPIINFFLTKIGRVELLSSQDQMLSVDFLIRPECVITKQLKDKFIENINFVSMQLKLESIYNQGVRFLLLFQNQIDFYRRWNRVIFVTFLTKNFDMITYLNFAVIVAQNIVLIANVNSKDEFFITTSLDQPFVWLQIISTAIAGLIMVAYIIKDVHLLIKNINLQLKMRAQSYGSNYNNYNIVVKLGIKVSMVLLDPTFAYHLIYTLIVGLVFYNKLFAALLLLDIFFQIPTLKNLLMSIWRPKIELILAIVSFVLVQYFFSIFMFFNFKQETLGLCTTLGSCFGFVFITTYKTVGGFVGYLFLKNGSQITSVDFFEIFQDIYVVLVFQIFFALILAIIIDTFSLIRHEQTERKDYLNDCCIICNLNKTRFNSSNMSFKAHIAITHNVWNYFYYYEYIHHKSPYKRTPSERLIYLTRNANWLPVDASLDVGAAGEEKLYIRQ